MRWKASVARGAQHLSGWMTFASRRNARFAASAVGCGCRPSASASVSAPSTLATSASSAARRAASGPAVLAVCPGGVAVATRCTAWQQMGLGEQGASAASARASHRREAGLQAALAIFLSGQARSSEALLLHRCSQCSFSLFYALCLLFYSFAQRLGLPRPRQPAAQERERRASRSFASYVELCFTCLPLVSPAVSTPSRARFAPAVATGDVGVLGSRLQTFAGGCWPRAGGGAPLPCPPFPLPRPCMRAVTRIAAVSNSAKKAGWLALLSARPPVRPRPHPFSGEGGGESGAPHVHMSAGRYSHTHP